MQPVFQGRRTLAEDGQAHGVGVAVVDQLLESARRGAQTGRRPLVEAGARLAPEGRGKR
ncbi:MAG: hypothetical protein WDN06_05740 [Asticcacaulis sp.]